MGRKKKTRVLSEDIVKGPDGKLVKKSVIQEPNGEVKCVTSKYEPGQFDIKDKYGRNSMAGVVEEYKNAMCRLFEGVKNQGDVSRLIQQSVHHTERVKLFLKKANANSTEEDYKKVLLGAIYQGIQTLKDEYANLSDAELFEILSTVANDELKLKNSITYDIIKNNLLNENEDELE